MIDMMFLFICFLLLLLSFRLSPIISPFPVYSFFIVVSRHSSSRFILFFQESSHIPCCRAALFLPQLSSSFLTVCHSICWQTHLFRIGRKRTMMSYFVSVQRARLIEPNLGRCARFFFRCFFVPLIHSCHYSAQRDNSPLILQITAL